jgi:5-methylcytosine-specific restriction endonuclease McrA
MLAVYYEQPPQEQKEKEELVASLEVWSSTVTCWQNIRRKCCQRNDFKGSISLLAREKSIE